MAIALKFSKNELKIHSTRHSLLSQVQTSVMHVCKWFGTYTPCNCLPFNVCVNVNIEHNMCNYKTMFQIVLHLHKQHWFKLATCKNRTYCMKSPQKTMNSQFTGKE